MRSLYFIVLAMVAAATGMKVGRRKFLQLAAGAAALPASSRRATAQAYPRRPVRIVVGFGPGGVSDITTRLIAQWLSERFHQAFVVENRPGAGSNIGTEAALRAPPDGYTLLHVSSSNALNATLYKKLNFDIIRDTAPIAGIFLTPSVMIVNPSFPAKTMPEFVAYAKANPGKINMAAVGVGSATHISGELFKILAGVDLVAVQYRDPGPAHTDLITGQVEVMFDPLISSIEQIKAGKVRPLGVTTATRWETLPDLPAIGEFVPGYEAPVWGGLGAPRNTPADIVNELNREVNAALADPSLKARLAELGGTVLAGSAADFGKFIADETEKWAKVIKAANISAE
jgi:tripartite-type tricarboxylate transporter receptor subunit TctC